MQPQPCARSPGRTSFLLGFQCLCLWQFSSRGNAKEAMGTCVTCISVFGPHKSFTSLGLIWHLPVEQEFFPGCSGIEALHLNLFQILYLLFVLGKGNSLDKYVFCSKGDSFFFFLVAIVSLIMLCPAFAQSIGCQLPFPCGSGRSLSV